MAETKDMKLDVHDLKKKAKQIRRDIVTMVSEAGSGHCGGSLSAADIVAALFFNVMEHKPDDPEWIDRDRFVLSKGHTSPVLYSALARAGYFSPDELHTFRHSHSRLQGHPSKADLTCVECSTGSLGHGLSISIGMALAARVDKRKSKVYCLMGDGEQQEGSVWEAAMCAAHYKLDNLCAIVDLNHLQIDGQTSKVMNIEPLHKKYKSFGWRVVRINGHKMRKILKAFKKFSRTKGRPTVIIASTVKGKGVKFMENKPEWHGKAPNKEEAELALKDLN